MSLQSSAMRQSAYGPRWGIRELISLSGRAAWNRPRADGGPRSVVGYDHVIVLSGDAPMITSDTIDGLARFSSAEHAAMTLLSAELENPTGYGRVLRKSPRSAEVQAIVEEKAATAAQKKIREINSGFYVFDVKQLYGNIGKLSTDNPHAEYYLTDMAEVLRKNGKRVVAWKTRTPTRCSGEIRGQNWWTSMSRCGWRSAGS